MAENETDILELKFNGGGVNPYIVKPHEIAELIISFEKFLLTTIKENNSEIDTEELLFSFHEIDDKSLDLRFVPKKVKDVVISSYLLVTSSFNSGDFSPISNVAIDSLKTFTKFSKKYNCIGSFSHNNKTISTFNQSTEIPVNKIKIVKGETTILGKLIDVGGEKPNVHIKINDDYVLIFPTSENNAKKLATRLFEKISLTGVATWDAVSLKIETFKLLDIHDYSPGNTSTAIKDLKKLTSGIWDKYNTNDDINKQLLRD